MRASQTSSLVPALWLAVLVGFFSVTGRAAESGTSTPIRVGVLEDNFPFSYRDEHGVMRGFAYDVVEEVEKTMGLRLQRVAGTTATINAAFAAGELEMLQSFARSPEREQMADFSFPYETMAGAIFVRDDVKGVSKLEDLRGHKVMVHRGSLGESVLRRAGLDASIVIVDSVEQAFLRLERGEGEATLATRLTGLSLASRRGLKHVRALEAVVPGYDVRYCIALRKGQEPLLARVNEGLAVMVRTGRFDALFQKWFGAMEPTKYTQTQVMMTVAAGLALALAVTAWAWRRQSSLRRRIFRQAEELRLSEERYRIVFEEAHDGLLVLGAPGPDGDFPVERINPAARRLFGLEADGAVGAGLRVLARDAGFHDLVVAALAQGRAVEGEHVRPGGAEWWRVSVGPLGTGSLVKVTDISDMIRTRNRVLQQEEQLRHTQKLEAIGTLAGGVAHDFNNLLTTIMCNTELGLQTLPRERAETGNLQQVLGAARRARQLVRQILTFSRQSAPTRERLAISPIVEETVNFLTTIARGAVRIEHRKAPPLPPIVGDSAQLHQVLMNIGTNAVQAMKGTSGELVFAEEEVLVNEEMRAQYPQLKAGCYVRIVVRDSGPGMSPEIQRRIFEPFFTTKPVGEGTGLGLSVVHGIMQAHGGAVTVYSQPGRGSVFHLYFPAAITAGEGVATEELAPVPLGAGELVLVVDDDTTIGRIVDQSLVRLGYRVIGHTRPEAALEEYVRRQAEIALVLTDLAMPGMTGIEWAARVRALRRDVPIVIMSGFFSDAEEDACDALHIVFRLDKPLTYAGLGRAVGVGLGKLTSPTPPAGR